MVFFSLMALFVSSNENAPRRRRIYSSRDGHVTNKFGAYVAIFGGAVTEEEKLHDLWRSYDRLQQGRGS